MIVRRALHTSTRASAAAPLTVGLRREDPRRVWERRCPLDPPTIETLTNSGVQVLVQPCSRRIFPMSTLLSAGAVAHDTLEPAHVVIGIKEPELAEVTRLKGPVGLKASRGDLQVERTWLMFSHTTKGQVYNMPLLAEFLDAEGGGKARLVDWEGILDQSGKRTVGFGWFAGVAGALEYLSAMAHTHLQIGVASPFLYTPRPHTLPSLSALKSALRTRVGQVIETHGTPKELGPCVICVSGSGKVSTGALDLLHSSLPTKNITAADLKGLVESKDQDLSKVYILHLTQPSYLRRIGSSSSLFSQGNAFDREAYYRNPEQWESVFPEIAPYVTMLINGAGWSPGSPRIMPLSAIPSVLDRAKGVGKGRFRVVGDVSCDVEGGLELTTHSTTLSQPTFVHPSGVTVMSVDILPASVPLDASEHFAQALRPYLWTVLDGYRKLAGATNVQGNTDVEEALERATVAEGGKLKSKHAWLGGEVAKWRSSLPPSTRKGFMEGKDEVVNEMDQVGAGPTGRAPLITGAQFSRIAEVGSGSGVGAGERKNRVLLLGSGMVAGPAVDEICRRKDVQLVVGSNVLSEAQALVAEHENADAVHVDMGAEGASKVSELVDQADVVISLLPVPFHPQVAKLCVKHRKHMITASYTSPAMRELDSSARNAGVLLLNEIGLDPGLDHCSATSLLEQLKQDGKKVKSFTSFCGGLPAPDALEGDGSGLGYKFSWSPFGVLSATLNEARFKLMGQERHVENILERYFPSLSMEGDGRVLRLEGLANRDSLSYAQTYGLGELPGLRTLLRGTLRYPGFADMMRSYKAIGLLDSHKLVSLEDWRHLAHIAMGLHTAPSDRVSTIAALRERVCAVHFDRVIESLDWLGILPNSPLSAGMPAVPANSTPITVFATLLTHRLKYSPGQRDMVLLSHEVVAAPKETNEVNEEETHTSTLVVYGTPRASAMARTVGMPVAFAALETLDGRVGSKGVCGPSQDANVWRSVLREMKNAGVGMREDVKRVSVERGLEALLDKGLHESAQNAEVGRWMDNGPLQYQGLSGSRQLARASA